jgi:hypothetical protein
MKMSLRYRFLIVLSAGWLLLSTSGPVNGVGKSSALAEGNPLCGYYPSLPQCRPYPYPYPYPYPAPYPRPYPYPYPYPYPK